jgi:hypothetical protein
LTATTAALEANSSLGAVAPAALFLAARVKAGEFDGVFYAVQALEMIAGTINLVLLGLNMRDGLRLARPRRRSPLATG